MTVAASENASDADSVASPPRSIVLVGPLPPPSGGMANQTRQLKVLLEREGCMVTLVQTNAPCRPAWIERVRGLRAMFRLVPYVVRLWRAAGTAEVMHVMANSGWAWHLFAAPAVWIAAARGVAVVVNYRGGDAAVFFTRQFAWVKPTLARASAVIVPSGFLQGIFAKHGVATTIVPNIVNLEAFHPGGSRPAVPHLIVTRNLEPIYDVGTAVHAFAILLRSHPHARLTIAGSGPELEALNSLVRDLGIADNVGFSGRLDNAQLPRLCRSASVLLNPARVDNMPISLLEAMASGTPIVSTNVGGIPHLVEHETTALLVPPGDAEAMARAALRVIDDPALAERLASAGIASASRYSWPRVRGKLFRAYATAEEGVLRSPAGA
jgi:L-malate glycosyltransferase